MNNYNFNVLSPLRFEHLTRDLLSQQYGCFENFAEGRDRGIDFRYSQLGFKILIVQCKRYRDVRTLVSNLKKETEKLGKLSFTEYILVVSLDLTAKNKEEILNLYNGKIQNANQIITNSDLNSLLSLPSNQHIEFKYPELWMGSINVHQKIFNLGFLQHAEFIKDKIQESLKNFVPFKEYFQLLEHYKVNNVAIISGNPGIGKTTLSHAIISNFIYFGGYQLIDLSYRKIQDAEPYVNLDKPTIFLLDDFLGKIKLDKENDYSSLLLYFIEKIERSENNKLIMTSREHILNKANRELFPINEIKQTISKYVIELKSFTRRIRTEILYNHLKGSNLSLGFIDNFLKNDFKKIIDHPNYNPRIIEHLTNVKLLKNIDGSNYYEFFIENLQNPSKVWEMVYHNLPNDLHKLILLVRFLMSEMIPVKKLEEAITAFIKNEDKFKIYSFDDFDYIISDMEGTFFKFRKEYDEMEEEEQTIIEFQNPSVMDFINSFIWNKKDWLELIIKNAIFFEQLFNWDLLEVLKEDRSLFETFRNKVIKDFHKLENAGIGNFEYENDEGSFTCWIPERYNYYISQLTDIIELEKDIEFANFVKEEIFRHPFLGFEDISERIAFSEVARDLLSLNMLDVRVAIKHYTNGYLDSIKDFVFLEYMTRPCGREFTRKFFKKEKKLAREADELFLIEMEDLEEMDFIDLMDFYDDFTQIKLIFPLVKASKKLKELDYDGLLKNSKLGYEYEKEYETKGTNTDSKDEYRDIDDYTIDNTLRGILK